MIKKVELTRFKKYKSQKFLLRPNGLTLLVGGNNSGKSTLIHALSVWEFCKMILFHEKGREIFNQDEWKKGEGFGMSAEEFLPIAVPSLNHLWTNLKTQLSPAEKEAWLDAYPGYIMRIKCTWDYKDQIDRMLEIGLSVVNDRLFIRVTDSNLCSQDHLLTVVYLPTFAGVLPKENKSTIAERRAFLGRGMAGSVIRNMIYDLYLEDKKMRDTLLAGKKRLSNSDKQTLNETSPLQKLQNNLRSTFFSQLEIEPFSEDFHTVLKIYERKLIQDDGELIVLPKSKYTPRDINQICVLSNGMETRLGSFAAGYEFFFEWLKVENEKENPDRKAIRENCTSLEYFIAGLCEPKNLLDYIENFILYDRRRTKIIAKNHQFFGVNNAYNAFLRREELNGKLGVFWHTQGSGKSYSMVMLARKIKHKCTGNFTFLIVTDREDLDTQIYKNFLRTEFITDGTFKMANNIAFNKLNAPDLEMIVAGAIISAIGMLVGSLWNKKRHNQKK